MALNQRDERAIDFLSGAQYPGAVLKDCAGFGRKVEYYPVTSS